MKKSALVAFIIALILFVGSIILHLSHVKSDTFDMTLICGFLFLAIGSIIYFKQK
ncbi:hypothetical protein [Companilactobacillus furfuricola]|uniref:hypothetical protein n=1 Tax=Companilactobacillus furfuricola TaxID=1462575 RepID=UPI0013DDC72E|nr:hypothetical protein [Companilactobacillus furfuricola]